MTDRPGAIRIHVAIALLWRGGRVLVRRRRPGEHLEGLWEFPGGKLRGGESPMEAAAREVFEEMGLEARDLQLVETLEHDYPDRLVRLDVFTGVPFGNPATPDGAEWAWVTVEELEDLRIPAANRPLVQRLLDPVLGGSFRRFTA